MNQHKLALLRKVIKLARKMRRSIVVIPLPVLEELVLRIDLLKEERDQLLKLLEMSHEPAHH